MTEYKILQFFFWLLMCVCLFP